MKCHAARTFAAAALAAFLAGCSPGHHVVAPGPLGSARAYVVTTDFSTGGLSAVDLDTRQVAKQVATVHSDATLRAYGRFVYVVNRYGQDNIQVIDPDAGYTTVRQFSTGNGSNPQDIVLVGMHKAYISRYNSAALLIVDPSTGAELGTISLAAFADGDGLPEMARMVLVGHYLFVACQRLTSFSPANPSVIVVIDTGTDRVVDADPATPGTQAIALVGRNPVTDLVLDPTTGTLLVGCVGAFGHLDGGIERIDPATLTDLGVVITETALGGDISDIAWNGPGHSYAIVSDVSYNASLVAWSATTGTVLKTVYAPGGFSLPDCEINGRGELYVCDNTNTAPGLRVYRADADTLIAGPLDTGLPPAQIVFR